MPGNSVFPRLSGLHPFRLKILTKRQDNCVAKQQDPMRRMNNNPQKNTNNISLGQQKKMDRIYISQ